MGYEQFIRYNVERCPGCLGVFHRDQDANLVGYVPCALFSITPREPPPFWRDRPGALEGGVS